METKFTKGEWVVMPCDHAGAIEVSFGDFLGGIKVWHHGGNTHTKEEAEANAKLISAAPDMLDVCEELVRLKDLILPKHVDHIRDEHRDEIIALVRLV